MLWLKSNIKGTLTQRHIRSGRLDLLCQPEHMATLFDFATTLFSLPPCSICHPMMVVLGFWDQNKTRCCSKVQLHNPYSPPPLLCQYQGVIAEDIREVLSSSPSEAATVTCSYISEAPLTVVSRAAYFKCMPTCLTQVLRHPVDKTDIGCVMFNIKPLAASLTACD